MTNDATRDRTHPVTMDRARKPGPMTPRLRDEIANAMNAAAKFFFWGDLPGGQFVWR